MRLPLKVPKLVFDFTVLPSERPCNRPKTPFLGLRCRERFQKMLTCLRGEICRICLAETVRFQSVSELIAKRAGFRFVVCYRIEAAALLSAFLCIAVVMR